MRAWQIGTFAASAAAVALGIVALDRPATPEPRIVLRPSPPIVVRREVMAPLVAVLTGKIVAKPGRLRRVPVVAWRLPQVLPRFACVTRLPEVKRSFGG